MHPVDAAHLKLCIVNSKRALIDTAVAVVGILKFGIKIELHINECKNSFDRSYLGTI